MVRGGFGIDVDEGNPLLGCCAGVGIALDETVQGRGMGRLAYRLLLERMIQMGVRVFRGTTANPAVIALAHRMRRPLRGTKVVPRKDAATRKPFDYRVPRTGRPSPNFAPTSDRWSRAKRICRQIVAHRAQAWPSHAEHAARRDGGKGASYRPTGMRR